MTPDRSPVQPTRAWHSTLLGAAVLLGLALGPADTQSQTTTEPTSTTGNGVFNAPGYPAAGSSGSRNRDRDRDATRDGGATPVLRGTTPRAAGASERRPDDAIDPSQAIRDKLPPVPSEFQRFVEDATGRMLPVFGSRFFEDAADSFAPVDSVPVPSDYAVGVGDELVIRAWGSIDVDYRATVDRNGLINLPRVGTFSVAGVKASELEKHLRAQIGRLYTNFNLNVTLGQLRGVKVFVVGPAHKPGVYTLSSQSSLLSAVVAAGGPGPNGSMRRIGLKRDGALVSELDVYDFLVLGDKSKDVQLLPGDVVVFQPAGARVALTGAIDTAAIFELKGREEPLRELLRYAGGASVLSNPQRAQLERIDPQRGRAARYVEELALDAAGLGKPMRDGDVLTLLAISPQVANAVTLKGHVAQPLRYAYKPGMRIRDLIPDKEALVSPDFYRRKNQLVQIEPLPLEPWRDPRRLEPRADRRTTDPAYADETTRPRERNAGNGLDQADPALARTRPRAAAGAAAREPLDPTAPRQDARELRDPTPLPTRESLKPAPLFDDINWDYAVIERQSTRDLSTQLIPFHLGKAVLDGDAASNVELQAGDVVTIYSQKDIRVSVSKQTRLVSVEGEVGSPGVYQLQGGETLKQLLQRAGGVTPQAYVYGLEFSREETRRRQLENLQQAIARLESQAATQAARQAANASVETTAQSAQISAAATQAQLQRLRNLEPNGRIALELPDDKVGFDALPDVPLEAGDRILVPPRPGFVTVAGAVANNNAFLWRPGRTVGEYLKLAGVEESADPGNTFVLRADGTVIAAADRRGFFGVGGGISSQPLRPGDAVFVPTQLDFETWGRALVRGLKDWSQIFYQFGLGAAAINTFKD